MPSPRGARNWTQAHDLVQFFQNLVRHPAPYQVSDDLFSLVIPNTTLQMQCLFSC